MIHVMTKSTGIYPEIVTSTSTPGSKLMLVCKKKVYKCSEKPTQYYKGTDDLLDDLAARVEVDKTLVNLELIAIPGLGTLTARL
jgi:hypothetical protein